MTPQHMTPQHMTPQPDTSELTAEALAEDTDESTATVATASPVTKRGSQDQPILSAQEISVGFGGSAQSSLVLDRVSLDVPAGEFLTVIGPSGSGKSTLLKVLAGLHQPSGGRALLHDAPVTGPSRQIAVVFQQHVLLPWLTARGNVLFALEAAGGHGLSRRQRRRLADEHLEAVHLGHHSQKFPAELSGGMQQRVGLARAFALGSDVMLLDEPLGALDALTRRTLQEQLLELTERRRQTTVMVTHDVDEALLLSDRILALSQGPNARIEDGFDVPFPRPRSAEAIENDPEYLVLRRRLLDALRT